MSLLDWKSQAISVFQKTYIFLFFIYVCMYVFFYYGSKNFGGNVLICHGDNAKMPTTKRGEIMKQSKASSFIYTHNKKVKNKMMKQNSEHKT